MKSVQFEFEDFYGTVDGLERLDVIYAADQEATRAERLWYRSRFSSPDQATACRSYANTLKHLIGFLRYGVRPVGLKEEHYRLFCQIRERSDTRHFYPTA